MNTMIKDILLDEDMKKAEKLVVGIILVVVILICSGIVWYSLKDFRSTEVEVPIGVAVINSSPCKVQDVATIKELWKHIYHPARLQVLEECKEVRGTIFSVKKEADGDFHIRLTVDPAYSPLINAVNVSGQKGKLVLEPICQNAVTQTDAIASCKGFSFPLVIPKVGDHIRVVGSYVLDNQHGGWAEIHPVLSFTITKN